MLETGQIMWCILQACWMLNVYLMPSSCLLEDYLKSTWNLLEVYLKSTWSQLIALLNPIIRKDAILFSLSFKNISCITAVQVSEADILTQATLNKNSLNFTYLNFLSKLISNLSEKAHYKHLHRKQYHHNGTPGNPTSRTVDSYETVASHPALPVPSQTEDQGQLDQLISSGM